MDADRAPEVRSIKNALAVVLAGVVVTLAALPFPVVRDYWDGSDDAAQAVVIDGDRAQFAVAFGLAGLGGAIAGIGLFLLGRAIAPIERAQSTRRAGAALVAGGCGLVVAVNGLVLLLHALFATPEFYVDSAPLIVAAVVGGIAKLVSMVVFGVLAWSAPPPKWTAVVLVVGGILNFVPEVADVALGVFALANLVVIRRGARRVVSAEAYSTTESPA